MTRRPPSRVVDLGAVRRGLSAMPGARGLLRDVAPERREDFARWAEGEPARVKLRARIRPALAGVLDEIGWSGTDESLSALVVRAADTLDAYRSLRSLPALDGLDDAGAEAWTDDVGRVLAAVASGVDGWNQLDDTGRRELALRFVAQLREVK